MDGSDRFTAIWMYLMQLNCTSEYGEMVSFLLCIFYQNFKNV